LLQHALFMFTSIPQLRFLMVHHAFPMSKFLGCFPCSNSKKEILWHNILVKECLWSNSLETWNFFVLSTWVQLGNLLDTMRNSNLKKVVIDVVKEVVGNSSYAWTFLGFCFHQDILYFACSSLFLYVDRSLLHIVRPQL
jgi:hypothetical protein